MTTQVYLSPVFNGQQLFNDQGVVLAGGFIYTYYAGTTTPAPTYTTNSGTVQNSNPIVLNSAGRPPQEIWLPAGQLTKFIVTDSNGNPITPNNYDNIAGINDPAYSTLSTSGQWVSGPGPTYVSSNSFSVTGNLTQTLTVGRRCQFTVTAGTVYGTISASVYSSGSTTVTMNMDGAGALDSGLSVVNYALFTSLIQALPIRYNNSSGTNTYTATVGVSTLNDGDEFKIKIGNANTSTTVTLQLDSTPATAVSDINGNSLGIGDLSAGGQYTFRYDKNANKFFLVTVPSVLMKPGVTNIFTAQQYFANIALTDAATIAWDLTAAQVASFTFVSSNRTMGTPTNLKNGGFYAIEIVQNAGNNTITWPSVFKWQNGQAPTLSTSAGAVDFFVFRSDGTNLYEQGRALGDA